MLRGLPASIAFHAAIVAGSSFAWPYIAPEREIEILVPVTIDMQLDTVTNFAPIIRREVVPEPELEEPEDPATEEVEEEEPEAEEVEIAEDEIDTTDVRELPQEEAALEESTEVAEEPEDETEPEEKDEEEVQARVREPDDLDSILGDASDLFSTEKLRKRDAVTQQKKKILVDESKVEAPRRGVGDPSKETARVQAMIATQMSICWDDVIDLPNPERLNVVISVSLNKDGSLDGDAELVEPRRPPVGDRPMRVAVERALRAARKCSPYRLPKDAQSSYDDWKDINFRIGKGFGQ